MRRPDFGEVGRRPFSATFSQEHRYIMFVLFCLCNLYRFQRKQSFRSDFLVMESVSLKHDRSLSDI